MKKVTIMVVLLLVLGLTNPSLAYRPGDYIRVSTRTTEVFDTRIKHSQNLSKPVFFWKSVDTVDIPSKDLIMVEFNDLGRIFSGLSVHKSSQLEKTYFSYYGRYYYFDYKNEDCYIVEDGRTQRIFPALQYFKNVAVIPIAQVTRFLGFEIEYDIDNEILFIFYPKEELKDSEREYDFWNVPVKVTKIDEKAGFVIGVDNKDNEYKILNDNPIGIGIKKGGLYRFICDGFGNSLMDFEYFWHCPTDDISRTQIDYWLGKDYFRKNGVIFETASSDTPIKKDGKWFLPANYWNDLAWQGVKVTFDESLLRLSVQIEDDFYKFTHGSKTGKCFVDRKSSNIELSAVPCIMNGSFYIGLQDIAKIYGIKVVYKGDMASLSLPYGKSVEKIYNAFQTITNIQDADLASGRAKTFKYGQLIDVVFYPPTLLGNALKNSSHCYPVIRTADDNGRQYLQCFSLTQPKYSGSSLYIDAIVKKIDSSDECGTYTFGDHQYYYSGDITHNQCVGDTYKTFSYFGESYLDSMTFVQIDPLTGLEYDCRHGEVVSTDGKIIFKDALDKKYELVFPQTPWGLSEHIKVGDKYWLVGVDKGDIFEIKRFGQYDYTNSGRTHTQKIAFSLPSSDPAKPGSVSYINFSMKDFYLWKMSIPFNWWAKPPKYNPIVIGSKTYYPIEALADLLYANMTVDKQTNTVTYTWNYVKQHQWAYRDMMRFLPESIDRKNWTVTGFTTMGSKVNLLLQDEYLLEMFEPEQVIWIQANVYDEKNWFLKNVYKSSSKKDDNEYFNIEYSNKTFTGEIVAINNSELTVSQGDQTKAFQWQNASDYAVGQKVVLEYYNNDQKVPGRVWLADSDFNKVNKHYLYSTKNKLLVDNEGVLMIDPYDLYKLFPVKIYPVGKNLTLYNTSQYFFSFNDEVVVMSAYGKTAFVDGKPVELSEKQMLIGNKNAYGAHLVPVKTILDLLGLSYKIENNTIEVEAQSFSNPAANDIFDFDEVSLVKDGKTYEGTQTHTLFFADPKLKQSMKNVGTYRITGYISNINPEHVFVTRVEEWLP